MHYLEISESQTLIGTVLKIHIKIKQKNPSYLDWLFSLAFSFLAPIVRGNRKEQEKKMQFE